MNIKMKNKAEQLWKEKTKLETETKYPYEIIKKEEE